MPVRSVKVGETQVDERGRLVIPAHLRTVLGLLQGEKFEIHRLEGVLDVFGEAMYVIVPTSRKNGLLLVSYAAVSEDQVVSAMNSWSSHYGEIQTMLKLNPQEFE